MLLLNIVYISTVFTESLGCTCEQKVIKNSRSYSDLYFLSLREKKVSSVYSTVAMLSVNTER